MTTTTTDTITTANAPQEPPLKTSQKILIGGLGALTPIIMNLLAVDLEKLFINITLISMIAYLIKVVILFYIGGIIAFLNKDENKPIKLFQLGIYAPAMIIAFMNTNPLQPSAADTATGTQILLPQQQRQNSPAGNDVLPVPTEEDMDSATTSDTDNAKVTTEDASGSLNRAAQAPLTYNVKSGGDVRDSLRVVETQEQSENLFENAGTSLLSLQDSSKITELRKAIRSLVNNEGVLVTPLLDRAAAKDESLVDTLIREVNKQQELINKVKLDDPQVHAFQYPEETLTEQFVRGFFGWKSERLWFVVVGKFSKLESAEMYAKSITKEMRSRQLDSMADMGGKRLVPQVFQPYGEIVPEYCVVIGGHLTQENAKIVQQIIKRQKFKSIPTDQSELWKIPL